MHSHGDSQASRESDLDVTMDAEAAEADSAVGIAHKVNNDFSVLIRDLTSSIDLPVKRPGHINIGENNVRHTWRGYLRQTRSIPPRSHAETSYKVYHWVPSAVLGYHVCAS
jgi:hypothetical protein